MEFQRHPYLSKCPRDSERSQSGLFFEILFFRLSGFLASFLCKSDILITLKRILDNTSKISRLIYGNRPFAISVLLHFVLMFDNSKGSGWVALRLIAKYSHLENQQRQILMRYISESFELIFSKSFKISSDFYHWEEGFDFFRFRMLFRLHLDPW